MRTCNSSAPAAGVTHLEAMANGSLSDPVLAKEGSLRASLRLLTIPALLLVLILGTLICYWPLTHHGFVNVDDDLYIYDNPHIQHGITSAQIAWAFTTGHAGNWHPVTWLSHMI